ncbi:hypothetical protein B0H12DRAFT_1079444 [Mycena haematopus]|nr:hypothetical protein B0H12DRAFT_1079444 [Mycena haematopus]
MPTKRKARFAVDDEDLNEGSDSDDSDNGYVPRQNVERIHLIPDEAISISSDGRYRSSRSLVPTPASPAKKSQVTLNRDAAPPDALPQESLRHDWEAEYSEFDAEYGPGMVPPSREQRDSDDPHGQWAREDREEFLDELLRNDGRGDYIHQTACAGLRCEAREPVYRCCDCFHPCLYCEDCVRAIHERTPFHHVEVSAVSMVF